MDLDLNHVGWPFMGGSCKSGTGQLTRSVVGRVTSWTIGLFGS